MNIITRIFFLISGRIGVCVCVCVCVREREREREIERERKKISHFWNVPVNVVDVFEA